MGVSGNAIEHRVAALSDRWAAFAEGESVVLVWSGSSDELRLVDAFLAFQTSEARDLPDLFLRPTVPFRSRADFGAEVAHWLSATYAENRDALAEDGFDATWTPPEVKDAAPMSLLVETLISFWVHHAELVERVVLVVDSPGLAAGSDWVGWVTDVAALEEPVPFRILVLEQDADAAFAPQESAPAGSRMEVERLDLDMPGAYRELAGDGDASQPGVAFRTAFVDLGLAAGDGNLPLVEDAASRALNVAEAEQWFGLAVAVRMAAGAALLGGGKTEPALTEYRAAVAAAEAAADDGDVAGPALVLRSRMALAGALFTSGALEAAAEGYDEIARHEAAAADPILQLEAWRMATHAYGLLGWTESAWECGWRGLAVGETLEDDQRSGSTLPYLGHALLDLCSKAGSEDSAAAVHRRMTDLLGAGWEVSSP